MIQDIEIFSRTLHFHAPFKIAYEEVNTSDVVIIKLTSSEGHVGLGSASFDEEVTGESIHNALALLKEVINKKFFDQPIEMLYIYHEKIQEVLKGYPASQSAVEEAIYNLFCNSRGLSLVNLFGGYRKTCPLSITIGIKDKQKTVQEVQQRIDEGYSMIKLKTGLDVKADLERIDSCLKLFSSKARFMIDANQGYSLKDAIYLCNNLPQAGEIAFIEQPIDAKKPHQLKSLKSHTSIPIIADESVVDFHDAFYLLNNDIVDGINIKLMKCGGPTNFLALFYLAKSLNKLVIIGCMYESTISITTGTALALALPVDYIDLDSGHIDFYDDPVTGGAVVKYGQLTIHGNLTLHERGI